MGFAIIIEVGSTASHENVATCLKGKEMKRIIFSLLLLITILSSCDKDEVAGKSNCIEISANEDWTTENFKTNFTIQFPKNYEGTGMVGFEGNMFNKKRIDDKVELTYAYCGPTYCTDFGDTLNLPIPNTLMTKDKENNDVNLDSKKEFCLNDHIKGVLYYNTDVNSTAKYFIEQDSEYLEGLTVYFENTEFQEVESIIKTITKK